MKAMIWTAYGPPEVLQLREVPKPVPKEGDLLIRVRATSVTAGDCETRGMKFAPWLSVPMRAFVGITRPTRRTILGQELAGEVEAVGSAVTRFKPGDPVFASTGFNFGGYAEYAALPEKPGDGLVALRPEGLSFEEAAAVPTAGLEALHFLREGRLQPGQHLLINGAGGSIGTFGVQLAKRAGLEVTAVDSGEKLAMVGELGADHVVDYRQEDFTRRGETYDAIFDVAGTSDFERSMAALNPGGVYLLANPRFGHMLRGRGKQAGGKRVFSGAASGTVADLEYLAQLLVADELKVVIDRVYPLEELVEAHRYAESGAKKGNLVISVSSERAD